MATKKAAKKTGKGFTDDEKAAMKDYVKELKSSSNGEAEVLAKIAEMRPPDKAMAEKIHALMKANAPALAPRTWYGMPAYAKEGNVVCFFQSGQKFKSRYATLGFSDKATLDDGDMWPVGFALKRLGAKEEATILALVKKAIA